MGRSPQILRAQSAPPVFARLRTTAAHKAVTTSDTSISVCGSGTSMPVCAQTNNRDMGGEGAFSARIGGRTRLSPRGYVAVPLTPEPTQTSQSTQRESIPVRATLPSQLAFPCAVCRRKSVGLPCLGHDLGLPQSTTILTQWGSFPTRPTSHGADFGTCHDHRAAFSDRDRSRPEGPTHRTTRPDCAVVTPDLRGDTPGRSKSAWGPVRLTDRPARK